MGKGFTFWFMVFGVLITVALIGGGGFYLAVQQGTVNLNAPPDMEITMTASPASVPVGGTVTYTINHNNLGESPAGSVNMTVTMPSGVTVGEIVPDATCRESGGIVTCNLGTRSVGSAGVVTIAATVDSVASGTTLTASANMTVGTTRDLKKVDENLANNSASASATVQ